ncbi:MAG: SDR family NAD(P)-dependent oxidoreductase [Pseudomonadota bacterium]
MPLTGKTAIVTGAARGIGAAIATRFANDGAKVVIADIDTAAGEALRDRIRADEGEAIFVHCDVGDRLDVHNMIASAVDAFQDIHIAINNAGVVAKADFLEVDEDTFDRVMRVNLKGAFLVGQAIAQRFVKQIKAGGEPGTIINMSSINAIVGIGDQVPYCVSKGGLAQLTNVMALSLAKHGIRVNAIGPGSIMTEMLESVVSTDPKAKDLIHSRTPLGRIGNPEEVASIAAFLATEQSSYMTGQTVYVDGGRLGLNYTVPVQAD